MDGYAWMLPNMQESVFKYWLYSQWHEIISLHDCTLKTILTAIAVPKIPPAKLLVPNKPNTVVLCWSENQLVSDFTQFGQAVDWIKQFEIHLTVAYKSWVTRLSDVQIWMNQQPVGTNNYMY